MDAKTHIESMPLSREVTGSPARTPQRLRDADMGLAATGQIRVAALRWLSMAHPRGSARGLFDGGGKIFKTPYKIPDSRPAGQYVDKDLFNSADIPKTLLDNGFAHGECWAVTGCRMAENFHRVVLNPARPASGDVELSDAELEKRRAAWEPRGPAFGSGYVWTFAQQVGPARDGAVPHPGEAAVEKMCHAEI